MVPVHRPHRPTLARYRLSDTFMLLWCPPWLVAQPSKTIRSWQFVLPIRQSCLFSPTLSYLHGNSHRDNKTAIPAKPLTLDSHRIDRHDSARNPRYSQRSKCDICTGLTARLRARKFPSPASSSMPPRIMRILPHRTCWAPWSQCSYPKARISDSSFTSPRTSSGTVRVC